MQVNQQVRVLAPHTLLSRIRDRSPDLDRLTGHVRALAIMMTGLHGDRLEQWITAAEQDTLRPLAGFAHNLRRDLDAVRNGLSTSYSSGAVEGNINRLKMINGRCSAVQGLICSASVSCFPTNHPLDHKIGDRTRTLTWIASMNTAAYTASSGRLAHSCISATTLSVIREIVSFDTEAP